MDFRFGLTKTFTSTVVRAVGPSAVSGARGTLPEPAADNTNAFFAAPNGSDANPGTLESPFRSAGLLATSLTGPRPTGVFIRNGSTDAMIFSELASIVLASGENFQVEDSETALLRFDSTFSLTVGDGTVNGLEITGTRDTDPVVLGTGILSNCRVENLSTEAGGPANGPEAVEDVELDYSIAVAFRSYVYSNTTLALDVQNSVLVSTGTANSVCMSVTVSTAAGPVTHLVKRNVFANATDAIDLRSSGTARADTWDIESNAAVQISNFLDSSGTSALTAVIVDLDFNFLPVALVVTADFLTAAPTFTNTDELDSTVPPLFTDQQGAINAGTADGFRLQLAGKATPDGNGRYFINSPLLDTGVAGVDVAPWDETLTGPVLAYSDTFPLRYEPGSISFEHAPQNVQTGTDLRGNLHETDEGIRRAWDLIWSSYQNNHDRLNLIRMLKEQGTVQFYPDSVGSTLFTQVSSGVIDDTTGILTPTGLTDALIPGNWKGYWCTISGSDFYISDNSATTLTLSDKLGLTFPAAGTVTFSVEYILIRVEKVALIVSQENATNFTRGGSVAELAAGTSAAFEPNGGQIRLREVEDPDDGVS